MPKFRILDISSWQHTLSTVEVVALEVARPRSSRVLVGSLEGPSRFLGALEVARSRSSTVVVVIPSISR